MVTLVTHSDLHIKNLTNAFAGPIYKADCVSNFNLLLQVPGLNCRKDFEVKEGGIRLGIYQPIIENISVQRLPSLSILELYAKLTNVVFDRRIIEGQFLGLVGERDWLRIEDPVG